MFEIRNPGYTIRNVRSLYRVRKAMKEYRQENPCCAYCGRSGRVHVHHQKPVSQAPELAGDKSNMMTLCAKRCHITIGHMGDWRTYNALAGMVSVLACRGRRES